METGNRGNGNGKVDAGEWVQLSVALSSISRQPAYSTSAWVSSSSACAWVKERDEIVVPEFRNEQSAISFWVYISEDCPAGKTVPFTISIEDTWVNPKRPESLNFGVRVESAPVMSGVVQRIDGDTPGWSREQNTARLVPDSWYELRVDAQLTGTAMAGMDFVMPTVSGGISMAPDSYMFAPMVRSSYRFIASDDLDFRTPDLQQGTKWLKAMDRPWAENPSPRAMYGANVYALTINEWFDEPQIKRQYSYRQEFALPFTREVTKAPPPPPPPKPVAVKPPPAPPVATPPAVKQPVASTVLSLGFTSFRAVAVKVLVEGKFFDSVKRRKPLKPVNPQDFLAHFSYPCGEACTWPVDAFYGAIDEGVGRVFSFTAGPRVNVVNMDRVQLGTFAGFGVRSIFESLQSDVQPITEVESVLMF